MKWLERAAWAKSEQSESALASPSPNSTFGQESGRATIAARIQTAAATRFRYPEGGVVCLAALICFDSAPRPVVRGDGTSEASRR